MPPKPANNASAAIKAAYEKRKNDSNDVTCLMLAKTILGNGSFQDSCSSNGNVPRASTS